MLVNAAFPSSPFCICSRFLSPLQLYWISLVMFSFEWICKFFPVNLFSCFFLFKFSLLHYSTGPRRDMMYTMGSSVEETERKQKRKKRTYKIKVPRTSQMKTYLETKSIMKLYLLRFPKQAAPSVGTWLMECEKHLLTKDVSWAAQQIRKAEGLHVKKEKNLSWGLFLFSFNSIYLHTCQHNFILYMCKKTHILHFENNRMNRY